MPARLLIEGGVPLKGKVAVSAAKNAALPALAASLLTAEPLTLPKQIGGGGGTSFVPVFDWITAAELRPDLMLYFTDAEGYFPATAPDYPVIWLVKGRGKVPWGERIQLN